MDRPLLRSGFVLILAALLTGFAVPAFANAPLGLTAHVVGFSGGMFLIVLAMVWPALRLSARAAAIVRWSWLYAAFANWFASLLGALTGASRFTPLAGATTTGSAMAENVVAFLLLSLSIAAVGGTVLIHWDLRETAAHANRAAPTAPAS